MQGLKVSANTKTDSINANFFITGFKDMKIVTNNAAPETEGALFIRKFIDGSVYPEIILSLLKALLKLLVKIPSYKPKAHSS